MSEEVISFSKEEAAHAKRGLDFIAARAKFDGVSIQEMINMSVYMRQIAKLPKVIDQSIFEAEGLRTLNKETEEE